MAYSDDNIGSINLFGGGADNSGDTGIKAPSGSKAGQVVDGPNPNFKYMVGSNGNVYKVNQKTTVEKAQSIANNVQSDSDTYQKNLPGIQQGLISSAQDTAKRNLANDIQGVKSNANARGLLYSGVEAGNEATAKGIQSAKLASNIQNINQTTQSIADQKRQLAIGAQQSVDTADLWSQQLNVQQQETAYEQALNEQQANSGFFSSLLTGAGIAAGAVLGGPAGAMAGAAAGNAAGGVASRL